MGRSVLDGAMGREPEIEGTAGRGIGAGYGRETANDVVIRDGVWDGKEGGWGRSLD
jgi:hypothetical protein